MATADNDKNCALKAIANRYHLKAIYVFGSRCEEIFSQLVGKPFNADLDGSDVDIGIQPPETSTLSPRDKAVIAVEFEDLFQVPRVDVVVLSVAPPFLALDIIRGELIYCSDYDAQAEYELYVLGRAGDLAYFERKRRRHVLYGEE